ncbi:MAG: FAD/NAD(P)-binding protein [Hyphomicrobiaceae bacterium]|nr:FAD/NAD(P)-binding protein [Hyphomicrobiaceae bacterium]
MNVRFHGPVIAIVGGGFTGAAIAYHLARARTPGRTIIFEPRARVGGGLAYSSEDGQHRINVPAGKMSLLPDADDHFLRWIERTGAVDDDPEALAPDGQLYPRRSVFGRYVNAHVAPLIDDRTIRHVQDHVVLVKRDGTNWFIQTDNGSAIRADVVIIATTHPAPVAPRVLTKELAGDPRFVADATRPDALAQIGASDSILVVGNGLTAADVIASLDARGHRGRITALSRRGLRSRGHPDKPAEPFGLFTDPPPVSAIDFLRRVRAEIGRAAAQGISWHPVIDAVRAQAQTIWPLLPVAEQRKIVRHLRPFWDVHRFRIAPQPEAVIARRIAEGWLSIVSGSIVAAEAKPESISIAWRDRRSRATTETFNAVIVTTGPAHESVLQSQSYLAGLAHDGWLVPDAVGLGISCDRQGRAISSHGISTPTLYVAGPLARGTFGELMGLPQVSHYARQIALSVAADFALPATADS